VKSVLLLLLFFLFFFLCCAGQYQVLYLRDTCLAGADSPLKVANCPVLDKASHVFTQIKSPVCSISLVIKVESGCKMLNGLVNHCIYCLIRSYNFTVKKGILHRSVKKRKKV